MFLKAPHGRKGNDRIDANVLQGRDVGARRHFGWGENVASAVTSEEGYGGAFGGAGYGDGRRGIAPGGLGIEFRDIRKVPEGVEPCATDNTQSYGFCVDNVNAIHKGSVPLKVLASLLPILKRFFRKVVIDGRGSKILTVNVNLTMKYVL